MTNNGPKKLKNGMIAIIDGYISNKSKKWLDIEITNYFPMIALPDKSFLISPDGKEDISNYDHLSIPGDLRLHLSSKENHIFFDASVAWALQDGEGDEPLHFFSYIDLPTEQAPFLIGLKKRKWNEVVLL